MVYQAGSIRLPAFLFLKNKKGSRQERRLPLSAWNLCLGGSTDGACFSAGTALDAGVGIDLKLAVSFADRGYRAFGSASAAADAFIGNLVSHLINLLIMFTRSA